MPAFPKLGAFWGTAMLVLLLLAAVPHQQSCWALNDSQLKDLKSKSPAFKAAEEDLQEVWRQLMTKWGGPDKESLKQIQLLWTKAYRDREASQLMDKGATYAEAYTSVTRNKTAELKTMLEQGPTPGIWVDTDQNCLVWHGNSSGTYRASWTGGCENGLAVGQGTLVVRDGKQALYTYNGPLVGGKREGPGLLETADQTRYEGNFHGHLPHGHGVEDLSDGQHYEGMWNCGVKQGPGRMNLPDFGEYTGEFSDNTFHGQGVMVYADGRKYRGAWEKGLKHGPGQVFGPNDKLVAKGIWVEDALDQTSASRPD